MSETLDAVNDELEQAILGHCLLPGVYALYDPFEVTVDDFRRDAHQRIWKAIVDLAFDGLTVDLVVVRQRLLETGDMAEVGEGYYAELLSGYAVPDRANVEHLVGKLKDARLARAAGYHTTRFAQALKEPGAIRDGVLVRHLDALQALINEHAQVGAVAPWLDADAQIVAHRRDHALEQGYGVPFGLPSLDGVMHGVRAGEVCGLLARPGIGKTVFCCHIAKSAAQGAGVVIFSLEMPASQIVGRLMQMLYGLSRHQLERNAHVGALAFEGKDPDDRYREAFRNMVVVDTPGMTISEMNRRVRQIASGPLKGVPVRLIIVDHLGLVGGDRALSTYDRVSQQARDVKELAKRLEAAVLLAVQVSREAGGDGERELGLGSARDSGVVEEAMDYMIGIRRLDRASSIPEADRERFYNVLFAKVIKHRHGDPPTGEFAYRFHPVGLTLNEDHSLRVEENDVARIAAARSRGRR